MKFSSSALLAAFALVGTCTTTTNALVPTKLSYLTEQEWEAAAANYAPPVKEASSTSTVSSFLEQASSAILQLGHRVLDDADGGVEGEAFEAAAGGDVDDDEVNSGDAVSFDPPIAYSQYTSDTCDSDSLTFSGTISSIKLIEEGDDNGGSVFCATGEVEGEPIYTKITNVECSILGVEDKFETCSDEDCSKCDDGNALGFTTWDQVFPDPVEDHCFQQIFSKDGETFDDETNANIDFQFDTASTDAGVRYTTFIVLNSCIQTFVSSDGVVFTDDSITVTDDEGGSTTLTDDSLTMEDADGGTIVFTDDSVTLSGADDDEGLVISDADLTATDDGGLVIENDDIQISITEEGDFVATTDDSITLGDADGNTIVLTDDSVTLSGADDDAGLVLDNADVTETDDGGVLITATDDELGDMEIQITEDGDTITTTDDFVITATADGDFMIATDDSITYGNEDVYVVFMEDSAIFGSTVTGSSFTATDLVIEATEDEEGIMVTNSGGGTITFYDDKVILTSVNEEDPDLVISDPVYSYMEEKGYFTIQGPTDDCDDFGLAFDADGLVMGSIDCEFSIFAGDMTPEDIDDEMMGDTDDDEMGDTDDDAIVVSGSGDIDDIVTVDEAMSAAGDSGSSCETIEQLLCSGALSAKFTVLCSLLQATPIPALTLTVFAPTDTAFGNLLALFGVSSPAEVDIETLTMILMFHVAPGQHLLDDLECGELLPMIGSGSSRTKCNGPKREAGKLEFIMQKGGGNRKNDIDPTIIFPDMMACDDSVVHVINEVMLPNDIDKIKKRK
mmetsp:Transcript_40907/g.46141  ORF Transcript_40907/g.46141 Transcript_40907/m.46141 type:complete len:791 (-) Transcript_40907:420-2792(-)